MRRLIWLVLLVVLVATGCSVTNRHIIKRNSGDIIVENDDKKITITGPGQARRTAVTSKYLNMVVEDELRRERAIARHKKIMKAMDKGERSASFIALIVNKSSTKKYVIVEDSTTGYKWSFDLEAGNNVPLRVETGLYRIIVYKFRFDNKSVSKEPVLQDTFRVQGDPKGEYWDKDGKIKYHGGYVITGD